MSARWNAPTAETAEVLQIVFKRRTERSILQKAREFVLPASGYRRAMQYLWRRLLRLNASPHTVAFGFSIGVYVSFSPFVGFHLALSGLFAWLFRANIAASMLGNFLGNPLSYPFMWAAAYQTGALMLGKSAAGQTIDLTSLSFDGASFWDLFVPFFAGSIPVGVIAGLVFYFPVRNGVARFQEARRMRFVRTHPSLAAGGVPSQTGAVQ
ncbi:MAG: DUF2062 domain-containing protein [Alphaproteobacteria bacterium]